MHFRDGWDLFSETVKWFANFLRGADDEHQGAKGFSLTTVRSFIQ